MENKEFILQLTNGNWQRVICKDLKVITDDTGNKLEFIEFIESESEENIIPIFLNINEVVSIVPAVKKNKSNKDTTIVVDIIDDEQRKIINN